MASGRLVDYLAAGLASAKPATPALATGAIGYYYATDTDHTWLWDGAAWHDRGAGAIGTLSGLSDVLIAGLTNGQVLAWDTATSKWKNVTPSGGGGGSAPWYFNPPLAASFTSLVSGDGTLPTVTDHANVGLIANLGAAVTGDKTRAVLKPIPNPNVSWSAFCHYRWNVMKSNYMYGGFMMRDSVGGAFFTMGPIEDGGGDFTVRHFGTLTGGGSNLGSIGTRDYWEFARVDYNVGAETLTFYCSQDGASWLTLATVARATYYANRLDKVGFGITFNNGTGVPQKISCDALTIT